MLYDPAVRYERTEKVGEGTYGVVYKATNKQTGEIVALKKIRLETQEEGVPSTAIREVAALTELDHPNIIRFDSYSFNIFFTLFIVSFLSDFRLIDIIHQGSDLYLVFEYQDRDLKKHMDMLKERGIKFLSPPIVKVSPTYHRFPFHSLQSYCKQLLEGMHYCHSHRMMHRDLKPQNLLVDGKGTLKIADFGLVRMYSIPMRAYTHEVVTLFVFI